jgi:hypothetical protein
VLSLGELPNHLRGCIAFGNTIRSHPKRITLGGDTPRIVMRAEGRSGDGGHTPTMTQPNAWMVRGNYKYPDRIRTQVRIRSGLLDVGLGLRSLAGVLAGD